MCSGLRLQQALAELIDRVGDLRRRGAMDLIERRPEAPRRRRPSRPGGSPAGGPPGRAAPAPPRSRREPSPRPLTSTGIRVGGPESTDAAMPACQSSSGTSIAASSGSRREREVGRQGRCGGVRGRIGTTDPGRVPGRDQRESERPDRCLRALSVATAIGHHRVSPLRSPPKGSIVPSIPTSAASTATPAAIRPLYRGAPREPEPQPVDAVPIGRGRRTAANGTRTLAGPAVNGSSTSRSSRLAD